jgi:hypothetical protein
MDEGVNQRLDIAPVPERLFANAMLESMACRTQRYAAKVVRLLTDSRT